MTHVTYRLTAKYRDQLRKPTLGNQVWAIFSFLMLNKERTFCCYDETTGKARTVKSGPILPLVSLFQCVGLYVCRLYESDCILIIYLFIYLYIMELL